MIDRKTGRLAGEALDGRSGVSALGESRFETSDSNRKALTHA
jgi:hypothetical protein